MENGMTVGACRDGPHFMVCNPRRFGCLAYVAGCNGGDVAILSALHGGDHFLPRYFGCA